MLSSLSDKFGHAGHFKGAGDTIGDIVIKIDAKFFGGGRYGHKCIPGLGAITGAGAKAYYAFTDAFSCSQLCWVIMKRDFRMIEDDEHRGFFRLGFCNTPIQGVITGDSGEDIIKEVI